MKKFLAIAAAVVALWAALSSATSCVTMQGDFIYDLEISFFDNLDILRRGFDKGFEAAGCDKYIIVGLTYAGGIPEIDAVNEAMAKEFGDHFVDIRKYMLNYGLADAGIKPTANDLADIKKGEIPSSLRKDYVHGNKHYHRLLGEQIYRRMQYLGYIPQGSGQD